MPQVAIDGRRIAWREAGRGPPALLLHCSLAHSGAWAGVMDRLAGHLALRALDLPGHGGTDYDPGRGLQAQATEDALALLAQSGPAHLVGHSFGGTVALRLAVEAPELVRSLTLIEPVMFGFLADAGDPAYAREVAESASFAEAAARSDWNAAAEAFLGRWGAPGGLAALPPAQRAYILARLPLVAVAEPDLHDRPARRLRLADLAGVARAGVPVLLLAGADSPPTIHRILDAVERHLPEARRVTVPGAGHMVPVTHPREVAEAIAGLRHLAPSPSAAAET